MVQSVPGRRIRHSALQCSSAVKGCQGLAPPVTGNSHGAVLARAVPALAALECFQKGSHGLGRAGHVTRQNKNIGIGVSARLLSGNAGMGRGRAAGCPVRGSQPRQACCYRRRWPGERRILAAAQHARGKVPEFRPHDDETAGTAGGRDRPVKQGLAVIGQFGLGRTAEPRRTAAGQDYCVKVHIPSVVPGVRRPSPEAGTDPMQGSASPVP